MTRTTTILRMLSSRNVWNGVRWLTAFCQAPLCMSVGGGLDMGECRGGTKALVVLQVGEHGGVTAECAGGEECVVRRKDKVATAGYLHEVGGCGFEVLVVAAEELEAE